MSSYFYYGFNPVSQARASAIDRILIRNMIASDSSIRLRIAARGYNGIEPHGISRWIHPLAGRREDDFSVDAFNAALLAGPRPDVIIAHTDLTEPDILSALMNAKRGNSTLLLYYDPQFLPSIQATFGVKMALGMADMIFVPSDIVQKFVVELLDGAVEEGAKIPPVRRMPYIVPHTVGPKSTAKRMELRGNLGFGEEEFIAGFVVEHSPYYNIPAMYKAIDAVVNGYSVCNACGSQVYKNGQLVNDCCGDETNLSAIASANPHVKFLIFCDEPTKWHSRDKFTSIPGLLNGMPSLANAGITILRGSWEPEIRSDAYNLCDIVVSLSSDIRPDLFAFEAIATGTPVIAQALRSGVYYDQSPDVVVKSAHYESNNAGESWPVPSIPDVARLILESYDHWVSNGKKKVFTGPRGLSTAIDINDLLNPQVSDIEIVSADGTKNSKKAKPLIDHP